MSNLSDKIEALEDAIDSGHLKVQYKERLITYRSLTEMRSTLEDLEARAGLRKSGRLRTQPSYDNGL